MSDAAIEVRFTASTAAVGAAVATVQADLKAAAASAQALSDSMKAAGASSATAFSQAAAAAKDGVKQRMQDIQDELRLRQEALREQTRDVRQADRDGLISHQQANVQILALTQQEQDAATEAATKVAAERIRADALALQAAASDSAQYQRLKKDEQAAVEQAQRAITTAVIAGDRARSAENQRETQQFKQAWDQSVGVVTRDFTQGLVQMAEGTKSFGQVMASIGQQIVTRFAAVTAKLVSDWLFAETQKTVASSAGAAARTNVEDAAAIQSRAVSAMTSEKLIFNEALKAAAGAYSAMAGIPIIGPVLGAVAASVTFAAVEAYGNMASAAGGFDIPSGVNPLTQLHANEMVLPASIASPLRGMLAAANLNGPAPATLNGSSAGEHHVHLHVHAVDGPSVQRLFDNHGDKLVNTLNGRLRGGARLGVSG
jgi:hypothetical protein